MSTRPVRTQTLRPFAALAAATTLLAPAFAHAAGPSLEQRTLDALAERVIAEPDTAVALAIGHMLGRMQLYVSTPHAAEVVGKVAREAKSPIVRAAFARAHTRALQDMGQWDDTPEGYAKKFGAQGCLTDFSLVGPFDNSSMEGLDTPYGPELGEVGPYTGKLVEVDWRALPDAHRMCELNLGSFVAPRAASIVYLSARIDSPSKRDARLLMGADGAYRVWLNGEPVARRDVDDGLSRDDAAWTLPLRKGSNEVVFKIASTQDGTLDLVARLTDAKLAPLTDLKVTPSQPKTRLNEVAAIERTGQGALALARGAAEGSDADAVWAAWLLSRLATRDASTPWRGTADRVLAEVKAGKAKLDPWAFIALAELFEEQFKRVEVLELARAAHANDLWVAIELADVYDAELSEATRLDVRALLEEVVAKDPTFFMARQSLADWYNQAGLSYKALTLLREGEALGALSSPNYLIRLESSERNNGSKEAADALRAKIAQVAMQSSGMTWRLVGEQLARGDLDAALTATRAERARRPWSSGWRNREVEILRAKGDLDGAIAVLDARLAQAPGDVSSHRKRADLLLAMDRKAEVAAQLQTALQYRPQDSELRDYLAHLQPDEDRFHDPWMLESDALRALASSTPAGAYHDTQVVDQEVVQVSPNGLAQTVRQTVVRANSEEGVNDAAIHRISFQSGDERVDVLRVRIHKPDGTISEDYDTWTSDGSRKASTTYNDNGTVTIRANNVEPGDLVEVRHRLSQVANRNFRGDYFGDISYIQGTTPVAMARYAVLYPESWDLHFRPPALKHTRTDGKLPGGDAAPEGFKSTAFEVRGVPAVKTDSDQPGFTDVYDYILVSNKKTYDEVGQWWWSLVEEQLIVDDAVKAAVVEATKGAKTDDEKVRGIYNYVVKNTRYLHVGLGIHGWKPYRTTTCLRNRYGDCKDKASLLKVMLDEAGIPANLVLVRTRRLGRVDDEPASMHVFNHAITYVPGFDLFLDGTAEFNGSRELTSMDQGAQALIVQDGGTTRWVTLPIDSPTMNTVEQEMTVDLTGEEPVVKGKIVASGSDAVYYRTRLEDPERRDEVFGKQLARTFPGAELVSATYSDLTELEKPVTIEFTFRGGDLLRESAARRFVYPMGAPRDLLGAYARQSQRDQDLMVRVPFAKSTTTRYVVPKNRAFGDPPAPTKLENEYGSVSVSYTRNGDELVAEVTYSIKVQRIPADKYGEFRQFIAAATAALNETVEVKDER